MTSLISLILARTHVRRIRAHTGPTCTHVYVFAFPGSVARTIALFGEHFCPEQPMNLSSNCRNNSVSDKMAIYSARSPNQAVESQRDPLQDIT